MKKLREIKNNQKGFTLVEVIVVLVILAIMAAILVPSLVGYIDKANQNTAITETRSVVQAVQTLASEKYAKNHDTATTDYTLGATDGDTVIAYSDVEALCEITDLSSKITACTITGGKVVSLTYSDGNTCVYPGYTVS